MIRCVQRIGCGLWLLLCASCAPAFEDRPSQITRPRVLALVATPPEVAPGSPVQLEALAVSPDGALSETRTSWAFCMKNRALSDNNPVTVDCLEPSADYIRPVPDDGATPLSVAAVVPLDGCRIFGSETPPPQPGQPPIRPVDPDSTGGYFQPFRITTEPSSLAAFGRVRISCPLAEAPVEAVQAFVQRYVRNQNPAVDSLMIDPAEVIAGQTVTVRVSWAAEARESYVAYSAQSRTVEDRQEALEVSWFTTQGVLAADSTAGGQTGATNEWTAPAAAQTVYMWAVVRDDRGGLSHRALVVEVR